MATPIHAAGKPPSPWLIEEPELPARDSFRVIHHGSSFTTPGPTHDRHQVTRISSHPFDVHGVAERLAAENGGYEVLHEAPGLEVGVYVLVAPEPDRQQPHDDDEIYVVLEGRGTLTIEGEDFPLEEGHAIFVPARAEHCFAGYEGLSVLVIFDKSQR